MGPVKRLVMGSVSEGVVHHTRCPVLVLRGGQAAWPLSRVVIGDDGSDDAGKAAHLAAKIGKPFGTTALLLQAYPSLPETDPEGRALDPRMVDDELRREKRSLQARAAKIDEAFGHTTTGQNSRGRCRGVPDRGRRRRGHGEDAHRRAESRSGSGGALGGWGAPPPRS